MSFKVYPPQSNDAGGHSSSEPQAHTPVLLKAALDTLRPKPGENYLDLTAGYGGHAKRFLERTGNYADSVLVDRDEFAVSNLKGFTKKGATVLHSDFLSAAKGLIKESRRFNIVLVDLGVSSPQLDTSERGFSFTKNGPLDMRMDQRQAVTAATLVNTLSSDELVRIITEYGEEPPGVARRIARAIIEQRAIKDTETLAALIKRQTRGKWKKIHPATRTFQALRIAVNQELRQVEGLMPLLPRLLKTGGRVGIISFHSLEDRLVKQYFTEQKTAGYEAELEIMTKKPLTASHDDDHNPRARSAKLRAAVKK